MAPVILFSAAIEEQPSEHHLNCMWQHEWMEKFEKLGYRVVMLFSQRFAIKKKWHGGTSKIFFLLFGQTQRFYQPKSLRKVQ